jgi:hypothetical protein
MTQLIAQQMQCKNICAASRVSTICSIVSVTGVSFTLWSSILPGTCPTSSTVLYILLTAIGLWFSTRFGWLMMKGLLRSRTASAPFIQEPQGHILKAWASFPQLGRSCGEPMGTVGNTIMQKQAQLLSQVGIACHHLSPRHAEWPYRRAAQSLRSQFGHSLQ